jgi:DNA-binding MarR family transcriptional regulator
MLPLERDGLIVIRDGTLDRRSKELAATKAGVERLHRGAKLWLAAQKEFEQRFDARRAADLRGLLSEVVACNLEKPRVASAARRQPTRARLA